MPSLHEPPRLLDHHPLFRSRDIEQTREQVARAFCTHELQQVRVAQQLDCRFNQVRLGALTLNFLSYGAEVDIEPGCLQRFYLAQIPVSGRAEIRHGKHLTLSDASTAVFLSPDQPISMRWQADCAQVLLRVPRELLEQRLAAAPGPAGEVSLNFLPDLSQRSGPTATWCRMVLDLARNIDKHGAEWLQHEAAVASMEDFLLHGLAFMRRDQDSLRAQATAEALPRHLQRAREFMDAHADRALTVANIASAACISVRALEAGFRRHWNTTPSAYLRERRLLHVHESLRAAAQSGAAVSIFEVAHRYGFFHLGRFSGYYKARFGESPSATLQRRGPSAGGTSKMRIPDSAAAHNG